MLRPYSSPDPVEKTFLSVGMIAAVVLFAVIAYSIVFLH